MLTVRTAAVVAASAGLLTLATSAHAIDTRYPPPPTTQTHGGKQTVTVKVTGTGVEGGSAGRPGHASVVVFSPCVMNAGDTGKEYYEWVKSGAANRDWYHQGGSAEGPFVPKPDYEKYKDDDKGHWYGGSCSSDGFEDLDEFFKYSAQWFAEHDSVYVPEGVDPPLPPIPPAVLREAATKAMTLPLPRIGWNPQRRENGGTLVNLATWVWLTDRNTNLYVEATAGGTTVRVDASLESMTVSAPSADSAQCANGGVPYTPEATGECAITFKQASPAGGKTPVTTQTQWAATWSINGQTQGPIPEPLAPTTYTTNIAVGEEGAVVRR